MASLRRRARRVIERAIGQRVGLAVLFARHVLDGEVREPARQFLRAFVQRTQVGALHLVAALHLPHQQLGIAANQQAL